MKVTIQSLHQDKHMYELKNTYKSVWKGFSLSGKELDKFIKYQCYIALSMAEHLVNNKLIEKLGLEQLKIGTKISIRFNFKQFVFY